MESNWIFGANRYAIVQISILRVYKRYRLLAWGWNLHNDGRYESYGFLTILICSRYTASCKTKIGTEGVSFWNPAFWRDRKSFGKFVKLPLGRGILPTDAACRCSRQSKRMRYPVVSASVWPCNNAFYAFYNALGLTRGSFLKPHISH